MPLFLPNAKPAPGPPTYDNSAISLRQTKATGVAITWTQAAAKAGATAIVMVTNGAGSSGWTVADTVTYPSHYAATFNSQSMTFMGAVAVNNTDPYITWVWALQNITGGSSAASVTLTKTGATFTGWGGSFTYTNVGTLGALVTNYGQSTGTNVQVPSAAAALVWGCIANVAGNTFSAQSYTPRQGNNTTTNTPEWEAGDQAGAAITNFHATCSASWTWSAAGLSLPHL